MTEIFSREKELFHINQELNMMALNPCADGSHVVSQSRYSTYLKQKGPSTLLKKKQNADMGAGGNRQPTGRFQKPKSPNPQNKNTVAASVAPSPAMITPRNRQMGGTNMPQVNKPKPGEWRQGKNQAKQNTANNCNQLPIGRVESTFRRRAQHKTATFVKYRNPNFKQSPSLDILLSVADDLDSSRSPHQLQEQELEHEQQPQPSLSPSPSPLPPQQQQQQQQQEEELEVMQQPRESTTVINGQSRKHLTQDNFIRFLKAKVTILEEDHGQLTQDMAELKERFNQALDALRKAEAQRDQAMSTNAKLSDQLHRLEQQSEDASRLQKERQQEYNNQQHELECLRRDMKILKQSNSNLENRLTRANDEAEATRQQLSQQATQHRNDVEYTRKELKARENRIKALKRQRADLLSAYKKQLFMIDNLKRQNSCMEQASAIGFGEKEFNKLLDWNTGSKAVF